MEPACLNCNTVLTERSKFCPQCGQKTNLPRLSLLDIIHDGMHYFIHADKSILHLFKALVVKNGSVPREYISGKRKSYFPPLNFFLVVATIFVLIVSAFYVPAAPANIAAAHPELNKIPDPVHRASVTRIYERRDTAVRFVNKYSNILSMIAVPLICLVFWLCYYKGRYNYTEHLVACMYMIAFTNLVYAVIFVPAAAFFGKIAGTTSNVFLMMFMFFQVTYYTIFYYRFINNTSRLFFFKALGVSVFASAFWFVLTWFLIRAYISGGFWGLVK
ncbi:MAG: DUF3667 domain-containing protein [Ferruginibacter sp.]